MNLRTVSTHLKLGLGLLSMTAAFAHGPLNPQSLLQSIKSKGPEYVYENVLVGDKWLYLLKQVESGDKVWLRVAVAIHPAMDGGPGEELDHAVGIALVSAPEDVLSIAAPNFGVDGICGFPDMSDPAYDTQKKSLIYLQGRMAVVRKVSRPGLARVRDQCLDVLRKTEAEVLKLTGPFP